jgi:hypothetical protein
VSASAQIYSIIFTALNCKGQGTSYGSAFPSASPWLAIDAKF